MSVYGHETGPIDLRSAEDKALEEEFQLKRLGVDYRIRQTNERLHAVATKQAERIREQAQVREALVALRDMGQTALFDTVEVTQ